MANGAKTKWRDKAPSTISPIASPTKDHGSPTSSKASENFTTNTRSPSMAVSTAVISTALTNSGPITKVPLLQHRQFQRRP